jgi:hypothetical protein
MQLRRRYAIGLVEEEKVAVVPISSVLFAEIVSGRGCEATARGERKSGGWKESE